MQLFILYSVKKKEKIIKIFKLFLGNHECFPADQFDVFSTDETFWLKNETSEYWQNYLDESCMSNI